MAGPKVSPWAGPMGNGSLFGCYQETNDTDSVAF